MIDEHIRSRVLAIYRSGTPIKIILADYPVSHTQLYRWLEFAGMRLRHPQKRLRLELGKMPSGERLPKLMPEHYWRELYGRSKTFLADLVWQCVKLDVEPPYDEEEVAVEVRRWVKLTAMQRRQQARAISADHVEKFDE